MAIKEIYQITSSSAMTNLDTLISEMNNIFGRITNRLDKLEGYRGTPQIQAPMTFAEGASIESPVINNATLNNVTILPNVIGIRFLSTPKNKIEWTAATNWTDVDISDDTGSDTAAAAILVAELYFAGDASDAVRMRGLFRKNGSSETAILPRIVNWQYGGEPTYDIGQGVSCMLIVEVDEDEIFETKLQTDNAGPYNISYKVDLIGYFI